MWLGGLLDREVKGRVVDRRFSDCKIFGLFGSSGVSSLLVLITLIICVSAAQMSQVGVKNARWQKRATLKRWLQGLCPRGGWGATPPSPARIKLPQRSRASVGFAYFHLKGDFSCQPLQPSPPPSQSEKKEAKTMAPFEKSMEMMPFKQRKCLGEIIWLYCKYIKWVFYSFKLNFMVLVLFIVKVNRFCCIKAFILFKKATKCCLNIVPLCFLYLYALLLRPKEAPFKYFIPALTIENLKH